jgi:hypothetical protein
MEAVAQGLNRPLKNRKREAKRGENILQGLKPTLI